MPDRIELTSNQNVKCSEDGILDIVVFDVNLEKKKKVFRGKRDTKQREMHSMR